METLQEKNRSCLQGIFQFKTKPKAVTAKNIILLNPKLNLGRTRLGINYKTCINTCKPTDTSINT